MNAIQTMLLAVPILVGGYALLSLAALTGAMVLAWDGARLFLGEPSQHVLHQRRYVTTVAQAVTSLVSVLLVLVVVVVAVATAVTVVLSVW